MSTLGGRLGHAARRRLAEVDGANLRASYGIATCAVDGIVVTTGCREGAGTLTVEDGGRHQLVLYDLVSGSAVSVEIRPEALALAGEYRRLDAALEQERGSLAAVELARRLEEKERVLDVLLPKLRTLPEEELLLVRPLDGPVAWAEGVDR
ncbi:MAG: hypothetical protein A2091_12625 [Desulfuromonadales bacterium GWD2_61_12]|nr:MAG: hypothetical protein A2005_11350 [Desulfuromonadales bacterium GWC2_61_20]OGR36528.1 MAG: hypothetical protein A2091_12625 [Desulfuromonadales bacterium GWD2_61_12]